MLSIIARVFDILSLDAVFKKAMISILILVALTPLSAHSTNIEQMNQVLSSIKVFRVGSPVKAKALINTYGEHAALLPIPKQLEWHYNVIVVSNQLDDSSLAADAFERMAQIFGMQQGREFQPTYLNYLGHFAMKNGDYSSAFNLYSCAIDEVSDAKKLFSPVYSMAMVLMYDGNYSAVNEILGSLERLASRLKRNDWIADVDNGYGVLALYQGDYEKASESFKNALDQYFTDANRNGELIASVKVLLTSLLQGDVASLAGIKQRVIRLSQLQSSSDIEILVDWISLLEKSTDEAESETTELTGLEVSLSQISNSMVLKAIADFILPAYQTKGEIDSVFAQWRNQYQTPTPNQIKAFSKVVGCDHNASADKNNALVSELVAAIEQAH